jgi:4-amino-4-deoxy-L-arabinose transferase-like glycosyltransferase
MSLFGSSLFSSHIFALTLSILLLFSVYFFCSKAFSKEVGLTAALILIVQPIFLAQSNLVLPEILLALLMTTALLAFLGNYKFIYWIAAALSMMTKESALILFCTIPLYQLGNYIFSKNESLAALTKNILFVLSPISIWLLFLIWQKITLGWFFFPEHQGLIDLTPSIVWEKFTRIFMIVFIWSSRNTITFSIVGFLLYAFFKNKKTFLPKTIPYLILPLLFYLLFSSFSAINFFTNRYLISLVVLLAIMGAITIHNYAPKKYLAWIAITVVLIGGLYSTITLRYNCDHNLGYVDEAILKSIPNKKP